jgi:hypothetical protein
LVQVQSLLRLEISSMNLSHDPFCSDALAMTVLNKDRTSGHVDDADHIVDGGLRLASDLGIKLARSASRAGP